MIVVTVELVSAVTGKTTQLGKMHICNDGVQADPNLGDYTGVVLRKPNFQSVTKRGAIKGHRRLQQPIWNLVRKMLANMGY